MSDRRREVMRECDKCKHRREVPGNYHIMCVNPDPEMTGHEHGIRNGWFAYPLLYDPTWKTKLCDNFEPVDAVSDTVSRAVSDDK